MFLRHLSPNTSPSVAMLHVTIHGRAREVAPQANLAEHLAPLRVNFDEVVMALTPLPQMFLEPDGWFVWGSAAGEPPWRMAGQLQDSGPTLGHVELKFTGAPPPARLDAFLSALGWPRAALAFVDIRAAKLLDETDLRRLLAGQSDEADFQ